MSSALRWLSKFHFESMAFSELPFGEDEDHTCEMKISAAGFSFYRKNFPYAFLVFKIT
jgi:hypothetical protein